MSTGLLDRLQMTQPEPKQVTFEGEEDSEGEVDRFRVGGKRGRKSDPQPSSNTQEVNIYRIQTDGILTMSAKAIKS